MHELSLQKSYDWPDLFPPKPPPCPPQPPPRPRSDTWQFRAACIGLIGIACSWATGVVACVFLARFLVEVSGIELAVLALFPLVGFTWAARAMPWRNASRRP